MRKALFVFVVTEAAAAAFGQVPARQDAVFEAVRGGKAVADIVLPAKAHGIELCAAEELAYHVEKATGARLEIVSEGSCDLGRMPFHFFVGATEAAKAAGLPVGTLAHEERVLKTAGGALYLLGGDVPVPRPHATLAFGPSARGTMYAVYDLLETEMGVRWLWPGPVGEYVPKAADLAFGAIDRCGIEPLVFRQWHGLSVRSGDGDYYGWSCKEARDRFCEEQAKFMARHRAGQRVSLRSGHAFGGFADRFLDTHPEYFQLKPDGTRGPWHPGRDGRFCSMCVSNPDLAKIVADDWYEAYVRNAGIGPFPPLPVVNACENDTPGACLCERCRALDGPDPRFRLNAYWNGSDKSPEMSSRYGFYGRLADMNRWGESATKPPTKYSANVSDRYAHFYNAVLAQARARLPEARVVAYAYQNYLEGPMVTKVDPGVMISFVPRMYLPYDRDESDFMRRCWENWRRAGVRDFIFRPNFTHALGGFPVDQARQYCEDIAWCADRGLYAISLDSMMGSYSAAAMHIYAITRSFRDPRRGYEMARDDMISAFGKAGGEINRYFDYVEGHSRKWTHDSFEKLRMANPIHGGIFGGGFNRQANILGDYYSDGFFDDVYAILDRADKAAEGDSEVLARIAFLRKGIVNTELTRRVRIARKALDQDRVDPVKTSAFESAFREMNAYRASMEGDYALNLHREAVKEAQQLRWPHKASFSERRK